MDFKGPIGGKNGFYYHVVLDIYSRYPGVSIVQDTKFETLKPTLEDIRSCFGYPDTLTHDGGPPYNSWEWSKYVKEIGCRMEMSMPEQPQSSGMCERMMDNLVKITHAAFADGKELA